MQHDEMVDGVGEQRGGVGRRGLLVGTGAAALAVGVGARPAGAADRSPTAASVRVGKASPVTSTIASAPVSQWTYRHVTWTDFSAEGASSQRAWGGYGAYTATSPSTLWASVEIPPGSYVREIEWYVRNSGSTPVSGLGRLWSAGQGSLGDTIADTSLPVSSGIVATRTIIPSSTYGQYPLGTKLELGLNTPTSGLVQVNGVRVGLSNGSAGTGILATPIRAYDSRVSGGRLAAGSTRTITLSEGLSRPGVTGVAVNVTVLGSTTGGYVIVYPGNIATPSVSTINFSAGQTIANGIVTAISSARQLKVFTSQAVHVILDVTATFG